jgi:hypothetical protein
MKRQPQIVLIIATLGLSWLAMQAIHEFGHIAAAIASGGGVVEVVLHPAAISFTRLAENPHPQFVAWMGPVIGVLLPLVAAILARKLKWRGWYVIQFFVGFCLIANGAYLAFGSFGEFGDAGDLVRHGAPMWLLWLFGVITIPLGLWMWDGLGPHFGLGSSAGQVDRAAAYVMLAGLIVLVMLEVVFSSSIAGS